LTCILILIEGLLHTIIYIVLISMKTLWTLREFLYTYWYKGDILESLWRTFTLSFFVKRVYGSFITHKSLYEDEGLKRNCSGSLNEEKYHRHIYQCEKISSIYVLMLIEIWWAIGRILHTIPYIILISMKIQWTFRWPLYTWVQIESMIQNIVVSTRVSSFPRLNPEKLSHSLGYV